MCPCLVPISAPGAASAAASGGMLLKKEYKHISLPNGKSSFEVSGYAYAPDYRMANSAQALHVTDQGLEASQASARRQNMVCDQ